MIMIDQHGTESAVVVGSSTHNERIERLWRDVHRCVSVLFGDLFRRMEEEGILGCLNELDMFCLHTVFLPRINAALDSFVVPCNVLEHRLNQVDVQATVDDFGYDIYKSVCNIVGHHLQRCTICS